MSNNRLIIVSPRQYGYQTDYLKYATYLPKYFNVVFLCLDQGERRIENDKITLKYTSVKNKLIGNLLFFIRSYIYLLTHSGIVMIANFKGCRYLKKFMPWRKMIVNIRTVSVNKDIQMAIKYNNLIKKDAIPYDRIIMISNGGAKQLNLPKNKVSIVSLGADVISYTEKNFDTLKFLYVGTLNNRDIIKTVKGFHKYLIYSGDMTSTYDIVGDGEEFDIIDRYIKEQNLYTRVILHGRKPYDCLKPFFDSCNVGVSFVPITEMYDYQPPTKTFEYINSGLFCLATNTKANSEVISHNNGMLFQDTIEDFFNAIVELYKIRLTISSQQIRETGKPYLWKNVIEKQLLPVLDF